LTRGEGHLDIIETMDYLRLGPVLREARRSKRLTQVQLSDQIGCSQSQISELEQGIPNAVSRDLLERIATSLEVDLLEYDRPEITTTPPSSSYSFCTNQLCPAARPFIVRGKFPMKPHFIPVTSGAKNCEFCGEVLASKCERGGCGFPVHPGFFCRQCSQPYIETPSSIKDEKTAEEVARKVDEFRRQFEA
jgi:transcriptional regulator with XRE-family HTH domain